MKIGRMMYNDKEQVPFEDEINRFCSFERGKEFIATNAIFRLQRKRKN